MLILGYVSETNCILVQECCKIVKKCFVCKYKILDLSSEVNTKRVFSILKSIVELYHICKFFKEETVFIEGKWWGSISENRYISLIKRKIHKKCEAITENYEKVRFYIINYFNNLLTKKIRVQVKMMVLHQLVTFHAQLTENYF